MLSLYVVLIIVNIFNQPTTVVLHLCYDLVKDNHVLLHLKTVFYTKCFELIDRVNQLSHLKFVICTNSRFFFAVTRISKI